MKATNPKMNTERCLAEYAPLVKRIAHHMMAKLPPCVQLDDIIQTGMIGLLDAINRYQDALGAHFETYAVQRIRGAILDGLRQTDWLPRGLRKDMRRIEAATSKLEQKNSRHPTERELAAELEISLADFQHMSQEARGYQLVFLEDFNSDNEDFLERHCVESHPDVLDNLMDKDMRKILIAAINNLPDREKMVISLYYEEDRNLREIGDILGVSESRVCQLHSQATARLRASLSDDKNKIVAVKRERRPAKAKVKQVEQVEELLVAHAA